MARIVDTLHPHDARRDRHGFEAPAKAQTVPVDEPCDDERDDVPFIEVGGPVKQTSLKVMRPSADPIPTIIPLTRSAPLERSPAPVRPAISETPAVFRISFQPLPFAPGVSEPIDQRLPRELVAFHQPDHPVSEQYRRLLAELQEQLGSEPGKTLLFASAVPGAGTTSVLLNLALTAAQQERTRVAVVDANFARPSLAQRLGLATAPGLREVLARTIPLTWALQESGLPALQALANGRTECQPAMEQWPAAVDLIKQHYDWVLIDAAEWGQQELPALAAACLATYLVLGPADLGSVEINDTLQEIPRHGGSLRGYVVVQR